MALIIDDFSSGFDVLEISEERPRVDEPPKPADVFGGARKVVLAQDTDPKLLRGQIARVQLGDENALNLATPPRTTGALAILYGASAEANDVRDDWTGAERMELVLVYTSIVASNVNVLLGSANGGRGQLARNFSGQGGTAGEQTLSFFLSPGRQQDGHLSQQQGVPPLDLGNINSVILSFHWNDSLLVREFRLQTRSDP